jgi:EmrB/QacA subfamily drug resistance transporter
MLGAKSRAAAGIDRPLLVLSSVVVAGAIMSILDTTIVNVAIPTLANDFHTGLSSIQWIVTGYMLALATVIPLTGWASERFGTKRLWMLSVVLFVGASALAGLSWSIGSLIVFRVLQGLGGGMIMPVGTTILAKAAGPQRMGRMMSVIGVPMLLGPVIGPILGGWLVQDVSWRWIFFVNLPIGIFALILAHRVLPRDQPKPAHRLDVVELALLSPGLALLVYGLSEIGLHGGLGHDPALVLGTTLAGLVLLGGFVWRGLHHTDDALIDLRLFRARSFSAASATNFLFGIALFGAMILLPLYYQHVRGEGALAAGLLLAPQGLGAALAMPFAGRLTDTIGARTVVLGGIAVSIAGSLPFALIGATTPYWLLAIGLFVRGVGLGGTMMPSMAAAYQTLERESVASATTSLQIIQRVGGSVGVALLSVVLVRAGSGATSAADAAAAFSTTFWVATALTAVAFIPALFLPRGSRVVAPREALPEAA